MYLTSTWAPGIDLGTWHAGDHQAPDAALMGSMDTTNDDTNEAIIITTASGARYHLSGSQLVRLRGDDSAPLRADGDPLQVLAATTPVVGERWVLLLGAGGRPFTRFTSPVASVTLARLDDDEPTS